MFNGVRALKKNIRRAAQSPTEQKSARAVVKLTDGFYLRLLFVSPDTNQESSQVQATHLAD